MSDGSQVGHERRTWEPGVTLGLEAAPGDLVLLDVDLHLAQERRPDVAHPRALRPGGLSHGRCRRRRLKLTVEFVGEVEQAGRLGRVALLGHAEVVQVELPERRKEVWPVPRSAAVSSTRQGSAHERMRLVSVGSTTSIACTASASASGHFERSATIPSSASSSGAAGSASTTSSLPLNETLARISAASAGRQSWNAIDGSSAKRTQRSSTDGSRLRYSSVARCDRRKSMYWKSTCWHCPNCELEQINVEADGRCRPARRDT